MADFGKTAPQLAVVLTALIMWVSFAWGLPAEAGEGDVAPTAEDVWAGVRISDAYDYAQCPSCGEKNELRAEKCSRCGYDLPQPSAEVTDPAWVFVPGKGYYREGTLLEPGKRRTGMLIWGLVLVPAGLITMSVAGSLHAQGDYESISPYIIPGIGGLVAAGVGGVLIIVAISKKREPVYAFMRDEPSEDPAYAHNSQDPDGVALEVELTVLGF